MHVTVYVSICWKWTVWSVVEKYILSTHCSLWILMFGTNSNSNTFNVWKIIINNIGQREYWYSICIAPCIHVPVPIQTLRGHSNDPKQHKLPKTTHNYPQCSSKKQNYHPKQQQLPKTTHNYHPNTPKCTTTQNSYIKQPYGTSLADTKLSFPDFRVWKGSLML